jgi:hypothetical protein
MRPAARKARATSPLTIQNAMSMGVPFDGPMVTVCA